MVYPYVRGKVKTGFVLLRRVRRFPPLLFEKFQKDF
jgi:hypothetical protein